MVQVHLANDDPISALDDAVAVLKIQPDDFTALCIKVTIWQETEVAEGFAKKCALRRELNACFSRY